MALPENFLPSSQGVANSITARDFDLSIERFGVETNVPGFSFMSVATEAFDAAGNVTYSTGTGVLLMALENSSATKLLVKSGYEFNVEACSKIYLTNTAQPGKMLRVYFSTYPFVHQVPQFNATPSQSNSMSAGAYNLTCSFASLDLQTILLPAANVNGLVIRHYQLTAYNYMLALFVGSAAPSSVYDTTKRLIALQSGRGGQSAFPDLQFPAGVGIYARHTTPEAGPLASVGWDLL